MYWLKPDLLLIITLEGMVVAIIRMADTGIIPEHTPHTEAIDSIRGFIIPMGTIRDFTLRMGDIDHIPEYTTHMGDIEVINKLSH